VEHFREPIANAVRSVPSQVRWKPDSAVRHLLKRKLRGHLPSGATLDDYERMVRTVLQDQQAQIYLYRYRDTPYVAVVTRDGTAPLAGNVYHGWRDGKRLCC